MIKIRQTRVGHRIGWQCTLCHLSVCQRFFFLPLGCSGCHLVHDAWFWNIPNLHATQPWKCVMLSENFVWKCWHLQNNNAKCEDDTFYSLKLVIEYTVCTCNGIKANIIWSENEAIFWANNLHSGIMNDGIYKVPSGPCIQ